MKNRFFANFKDNSIRNNFDFKKRLFDIFLSHFGYAVFKFSHIYIFTTSRNLDGKEKPKKTNDKAYNKTKRKEKTRESEKRSYKKDM